MGINLNTLFRVSAVFFCLLIFGCAGPKSIQLDTTLQKFNDPIGVQLSVDTGNSLFVEGEYLVGQMIEVEETVKKLLPGSWRIPFPVTLEPGVLELTQADKKWNYYCGEWDNVSARFPGLGSVIAPGDCVGIRIRHDGTDPEWVVDNSEYNGFTTIYSKNLKPEEVPLYQPKDVPIPQTVTSIVFDGFYGGQLHFTWKYVSPKSQTSREFIFDFDGKTPTVIGIKGQVFKVYSSDNINMNYEWIKRPSS